MTDILSKIKEAGLVGRGGACFPTADKCSMVKAASGQVKYVVCNCSEGEPGVKKDAFIIEHFANRVIDGMKLALEFLATDVNGQGVKTEGIFYLNPLYYDRYKKILDESIELMNQAAARPFRLDLFKKPHSAGYIGGEETTVLNVIEGRRAEPRLRPPFPPTSGLWGKPTLISNVETFYNVSLVDQADFKKTRFYTLTGDLVFDGVYDLPEDLTVDKVLRQTHNYPKFPFFVQVGGDGSGVVLSSKQLKQPVVGSGSIKVYSMEKYQPQELILNWINFFKQESCGQCTPCREGTYRLKEALEEKKVNWNTVADLLNNLNETAFCGLGSAVSTPVVSYIKNVLETNPETKVNLPIGSKQIICSCFE